MFHATSSKAVSTYKLQPHANMALLLFVRLTTKFWLPVYYFSTHKLPLYYMNASLYKFIADTTYKLAAGTN